MVLRQGQVVADRARGEVQAEELGELMASTTIAMP
jgi:hypothetical protein